MLNLLGEYTCKIDAKGRLMFPARLRKQLETVLHNGLVINRDIFEGCLVVYPQPEWDKVNREMSRLSRYNRKHQLFQRKFMKGATHVELDGSGRINIPPCCSSTPAFNCLLTTRSSYPASARRLNSGARPATTRASSMTPKILISAPSPKKSARTSNPTTRINP